MIRSVHIAAQRLLAFLILVLWLCPSLGAVAIELHVALDHHGPHGQEPGSAKHERPDSLDHRHEMHLDSLTSRNQRATMASKPSAPKPDLSLSDSHSGEESVLIREFDRSRSEPTSRGAPPLPLFTKLCSLLL